MNDVELKEICVNELRIKALHHYNSHRDAVDQLADAERELAMVRKRLM